MTEIAERVQLDKSFVSPKQRLPYYPDGRIIRDHYVNIAVHGESSATVNLDLNDTQSVLLADECTLNFDVTITNADGTAVDHTKVSPSNGFPNFFIRSIMLMTKQQSLFVSPDSGMLSYWLNTWRIPNSERLAGAGAGSDFILDDVKHFETSTHGTGTANFLAWKLDTTSDTIRVSKRLHELPLFCPGSTVIPAFGLPLELIIQTRSEAYWQRAFRGESGATQGYKISINKMFVRTISKRVMRPMVDQMMTELSSYNYLVESFRNELINLESNIIPVNSSSYSTSVTLRKTPDVIYLFFLKDDLLINGKTDPAYKAAFMWQATFDNIVSIRITDGSNELMNLHDIKGNMKRYIVNEAMRQTYKEDRYGVTGLVNADVFVGGGVISCFPVTFQSDETGYYPSKPITLTIEAVFDTVATPLKPMLLVREKNLYKFGIGPNDLQII